MLGGVMNSSDEAWDETSLSETLSHFYTNGSKQDCSNSSTLAMEVL